MMMMMMTFCTIIYNYWLNKEAYKKDPVIEDAILLAEKLKFSYIYTKKTLPSPDFHFSLL